jgi:PAS domain S-box-containing protein
MSNPSIDFGRLFESSCRALLVVDTGRVIVDCNPAAKVLIGGSRDKLLGKSLSDLQFTDEAGRKLGFRTIASNDDDDQAFSLVEMQVVERAISEPDDMDDAKLIQIALVDGKEQFQALVEGAGEAIFVVDRDGAFWFMNRVEAGRLGADIGDFAGKTMWDIFPDSMANSQIRNIRKVFDTGEFMTIDSVTELQHHKLSYNTSLAPIRVRSGDIVAVLGIARDVTKLVEAKEALRDREEQWRSLVINIPDIIITVAPDGTLLSLNHTVIDRSVEECIGTNALDYVLAEYHDLVRKTLDRVFRTREPGAYDVLGDGPDGEKSTWWESRVVPVESGGDEQSVMIISRDVTARKQTEQMLRESEERFRELADMLPITVYEADHDGRLTFVNQQAYKLTGYNRDDLDEGVNIPDLFDPEDHDRVRRRLRALMEHEAAVEQEYDLMRKDGSKVPVVIYSTSIERDGSVFGIRGIVVDVTERKRFEHELQQAYADLQKEQKQLLETNIALREVLGQIEEERRETGRRIHANMTRMVFPLLTEMSKKLGEPAEVYLTMFRSILSDLTSPYVKTLESRFSQLTRREIQVCEMIRGDMKSGQIATALNISVLTVQKFRQRIRRKLGLSGTKTNLVTYLKSLNMNELRRA